MKPITLLSSICFLLMFGSSTELKAQVAANTQSAGQTSGSTKIEGTYQIQMVNSRNQPFIPANLNELVTKNRQATEVKYVSLGTEVRLMILPLSIINAANFKPVERITYVKE